MPENGITRRRHHGTRIVNASVVNASYQLVRAATMVYTINGPRPTTPREEADDAEGIF
jgi:hypothetical protein